MNIGVQIKKYRKELSFSQDDLAAKVFVSRQSISNWENDKTYPDIKSLILLSEAFNVSLDQLVKGDIEAMKTEIDEREVKKFKKESIMMTILLAAVIFLPIPLTKYLHVIGFLIYFAMIGFSCYYAKKIDGQKKKYDVRTYKEIIEFMSGKTLDAIEKEKEAIKWPYQNLLGLICVVSLVVIIYWIMICLMY